jgi:hypothetical protein
MRVKSVEPRAGAMGAAEPVAGGRRATVVEVIHREGMLGVEQYVWRERLDGGITLQLVAGVVAAVLGLDADRRLLLLVAYKTVLKIDIEGTYWWERGVYPRSAPRPSAPGSPPPQCWK